MFGTRNSVCRGVEGLFVAVVRVMMFAFHLCIVYVFDLCTLIGDADTVSHCDLMMCDVRCVV